MCSTGGSTASDSGGKMSERKRGFDDGAESSKQGSAKKKKARESGDPSVDTTPSLLQPDGAEDGQSNAEQLQSQVAAASGAGTTQEEERGVALQGRGSGGERRTQDLILANTQASGIDGADRGGPLLPQALVDEMLAHVYNTMPESYWNCPEPPPVRPPPARPPPPLRLPQRKKPLMRPSIDPASLLRPDFLKGAFDSSVSNPTLLPRPYASGSSKVPVTGSAQALWIRSPQRRMIGQPYGSQPAGAPPRPPLRTVDLLHKIDNPLPRPEQCPYCHVRTGTMVDQPIPHYCLCGECLTLDGNAVCPVCRVRGRIG